MNRGMVKSLGILVLFLALNLGAVLAFRCLEPILEMWGMVNAAARRPMYDFLLVASSVLALYTWGICRWRRRILVAACMMQFLYLLVLLLSLMAESFRWF